MTLYKLAYEQSSEGSLKFGEEMCPIESYRATDLTTTVVAAGLRNDIASAPPKPSAYPLFGFGACSDRCVSSEGCSISHSFPIKTHLLDQGMDFLFEAPQHRRSPKLQDIVPTSLGSKIFMGSLLGYPRDFLVASLTTEKSANMDNSLLRCARLQQEGMRLDVLARLLLHCNLL